MPEARAESRPANGGLLVAAAIIGAWAALLGFLLLRFDLAAPGATAIAAAGVAALSFLYTGLFITAHDAMHGSVAPGRPRLNAFVGRLSVALYAAFSYAKLLHEHRRHHRAPASADDPDFHAEGRPAFWRWYLRFLTHYVSLTQLLVMSAIAQIWLHALRVPEPNLMLFWVLPSLLSTLQLFYFGTYLPHRADPTGRPYADRHRARTNDYPTWLSLLTCYHFGYHWEHHAWPETPWWRLPSRRAESLAGRTGVSA